MGGLTIRCYRECDECQYFLDGWCYRYDLPCEEVHVKEWKEDGEESNV